MTRHRTRHRIGLWAGVVLSLVLAASGCHETQQDQGIYVGLVHPQNGSLAPYGPGISKAVELAVDEINAAGGVQGQSLVIIYKDSGTNPEWARLSTDELIAEGTMAIIGARGSSQSGEILEITGPLSIPLISYGSSDSALSAEDYNTFFRTTPSAVLQAEALARLAKDEGASRLAILYVDNADGVGLTELFEQEFQDAAHVVTAAVAFAPGQFEYAGVVDQALAGGPDSLVLIAYPGDGATIAMDIADSSHRPGQVFVTDTLRHTEFILAAGQNNVEGWLGTAPLPSTEHHLIFASAYEARYGQPPDSFDCAAAYDAVYLLALAIQKADRLAYLLPIIRDEIFEVSAPPGTEIGPGEWESALAALRRGEDVNYEGASGSVDMDENGDVVAPVGSWRITNGEIIDLGAVVP